MKRAFVPAALHDELTEHTHLVRVLRTARTLDLTTHLLHHAVEHKQKDNAPDTWTSWPLIDCPVPEWSLQDEIQHLGETVAKQMQESRDTDALELDADEDLDGLSPAATKLLVRHAGAVLVHLLNLLADQRPSAPGSMQNRLWAMNWEDVISLLAVSGVVDPTIVARAEERLERIYDPSSTNALQRAASAMSAKTRCASLAVLAEDRLLAMPVISRTHRSDVKGPRHRCGVKSRPIVETDTDTDA